jgi:hypothetical protein
VDNTSFDTLARFFATDGPRRHVLASALAGIGAAALLGAQESAAKKKGKKKKRCRHWILSGGPDPTEEIFVDDDLTVFKNGQIVFQDEEEGWSTIAPIHFTARKGATLTIVAVDTDPNCHQLSPLYLQCKRKGGSPRKLTDGVPETCPNMAVGEFFNETFTI